MDIVRAFNTLEAGIWFTFAVLTAAYGARLGGTTTALRVAFTISFLAFAVSDIIEISTGAWWRPPSLLALKAVCLTAIGVCSLILRRNRRN